MSFTQLSTYALQPIRCYSDAHIYFTNTTPIRGTDKNKEGLPLRKDRSKRDAYSIHRIFSTNPLQPSYALRLYRTDVVIFHPDESITVDISYHSTITNDFATHALYRLGFHASTTHSLPTLTCRNTNTDDPASQYLSYPAKKPVRINPDRTIDTSTLEPYVVQRVNRSVAAKSRNKIRALLHYANTMEAMGPLPMPTVLDMRGYADANAQPSSARMASSGRELMALIKGSDLTFFTEPDNFPMIVGAFYEHRWYTLSSPVADIPLNMDGFKSTVFDCLYRLSGAYYYEDVPMGTLVAGMQRKSEVTK